MLWWISILDWRDPDDLYRMNGAEPDYYQSLKEPYRCKNGNLDSIEELLLVRGVTPELFYGRNGAKADEEEAKASDVGSKTSSLSTLQESRWTSTALLLQVLRAVLGFQVRPEKAILKAREEKGFENQQDLLQRVRSFLRLSQRFGTPCILIRIESVDDGYYTVESRGKSKEGGAVRGLKAIVKIDRMDKRGYKIIQWVDVLI